MDLPAHLHDHRGLLLLATLATASILGGLQ